MLTSKEEFNVESGSNNFYLCIPTYAYKLYKIFWYADGICK